VDELRQRIPSRLHVHKGRSGSRIEVRAIGSAAPSVAGSAKAGSAEACTAEAGTAELDAGFERTA
jgi:hypothetical protein